jgi:hypothetical protein
MPDLHLEETFKKRLQKKEKGLQGAILETVALLGENPRHPSLQTHPVQGTSDPKVFEAYVDMKNRVTWHWGEGGTIVLRNHCNHDVLKRP